MMWEQAIETSAEAPPRRNGSGVWNSRRVADDASALSETLSLRTERSLLEAERAWQERCEQQRRRETAS